MYPKSIYKQFYQKLILATSLFIIAISFIFYGYTKATIYDEIKENLLQDAKLIFDLSKSENVDIKNFNIITSSGIDIDLVKIKNIKTITYTTYKKDKNHFIVLYYPFDETSEKYIKISKNINSSRAMLSKISNNLFLLSLGGLIMVILYAFTVSKTLLKPIIEITEKLSNMNENYLAQIDKKDLPIEFHALSDSINSLTNKIQTHIKFKKELFIGVAHELKTPLAVMKLKSEVTLMKERQSEKYKEALKLQINQINDMNKMISSILDIGRQEGAQFDKPVAVDLVSFMQRKTNDYRMLSAEKKITITFYSNVNSYNIFVQETLLNQIIQNLVQNAIKFTPNDKFIEITLKKEANSIQFIIKDEGVGIDESIDLFAPFKRVGTLSGAGLGLFLAKTASDTLGATLILKNRIDGNQGCQAILELHRTALCKLDAKVKT